MEYLEKHPDMDSANKLFISLETAHPAKFPEEITRILGIDPDLPKSLENLDDKPEFLDRIELSYPAFKEYLVRKY